MQEVGSLDYSEHEDIFIITTLAMISQVDTDIQSYKILNFDHLCMILVIIKSFPVLLLQGANGCCVFDGIVPGILLTN